jgi:hypothetical protein
MAPKKDNRTNIDGENNSKTTKTNLGVPGGLAVPAPAIVLLSVLRKFTTAGDPLVS